MRNFDRYYSVITEARTVAVLFKEKNRKTRTKNKDGKNGRLQENKKVFDSIGLAFKIRLRNSNGRAMKKR